MEMLLIKATVIQQSWIKNNGGGGCYLKATVTQPSYNKINKQCQKLLLKSNCDTRELRYNKEQMKLLLKAAVTQQSYIKKITNSGKNEMLLTSTVAQGATLQQTEQWQLLL